MVKIKLKELIEKIAAKPILASLLVFSIFSIIIVVFSLFKYGYNEKFFENIVIEAHGMLFDILIIGIFIFALHKIGEKRLKRELDVKRYQEEIRDFSYWDEKEAIFRIVGNIRRLNRLGITRIDLSDCYLEKANLSYFNLERSDLSRSNLCNADLIEANLKNTVLIDANLEGAKLYDANLEMATLWNAKLIKAEGLTLEQLSKVDTLYEAELDPGLLELIKEKCPDLLEYPWPENDDFEFYEGGEEKEVS